MIWADADRIVQVLVNLLSNAVKFSPPGGVVTIGVAMRDWVEFRVTDRGRGVPETHRRAIFERVPPGGILRRAREGRQRSRPGHLQVDRRAAWRRIGVESEEGAGSAFWFRLATHAPDDGMPS